MSAFNRLQTLQAALQTRGVRDVKFHLNVTPDTALESVASTVADVLEAIQAGRVRPFEALGDAAHA